MKAQKNVQLAGLFFLGFDTYNVGSKVSPLELQVSPVALHLSSNHRTPLMSG